MTTAQNATAAATEESDEAKYRKIADSTWLRQDTIHPRAYDQLSDEAFETLQEKFIEGDHEALQLAIGTNRVGNGGVVYLGFDTEWEAAPKGHGWNIQLEAGPAPGGEWLLRAGWRR